MSNGGWGTKRVCPRCNIRFYDLGRNPAACPKCAHEFDPGAPPKLRRGRGASRRKALEKKNSDAQKIAKLVQKAAARSAAGKAVELKGIPAIGDIEELDDSDDVEQLAELDDVEENTKIATDDADDESIMEELDTQGISLVDEEKEDEKENEHE